MKASYLSNTDILKYIDSLTLRTLFVRMKILDQHERPLKTIEGCATGGSISINASSAIRRTGSLTLITGDASYEQDEELKSLYKVTEIDNLISMNKRVEIEIGLKNTGLEYQEYDTFWIPLGQFLITNASVTHNTQGIQIQVKLTDKMALLNGEVGGTIPGALIFSPMKDSKTGEKLAAPFFHLIRELVSEIGEVPENKILIEDISDRIRTSAFWNSSTQELVRYKDVSSGRYYYEIYDQLKFQNKTVKDLEEMELQTFFAPAEVGSINTDFVFPTSKEFSSGGGDTVASMLDKIVKELGNYEYFFDLDGNFVFREIRNYINEGSRFDDLELAIADGYFINTSEGKSRYSFVEGVNLVTSYGNNPVYSQIKNDYTVWGQKGEEKNAIRYHLIIDNKYPTDTEKKKLFGENKDKEQIVWLATVDGITRAYLTEQAAQAAILGVAEGDEKAEATVSVSSTFGRWIFNDTLIPAPLQLMTTKYLPFTLQGTTEQYLAIKVERDNNSNNIQVYYNKEDAGAYKWIEVYNTASGWIDKKYQVITFGSSYITIIDTFYAWLVDNATWQEKFIEIGLYEWNDTVDFKNITETINQNLSFSTYNPSSQKSINDYNTITFYAKEQGDPVSSILYTPGNSSSKTVYDKGDWYNGSDVNESYKIIYVNVKTHVSDDFYQIFAANTILSVPIKTRTRWRFNDAIEFDGQNFEIEFDSGKWMRIFEPKFETSTKYTNDYITKIIINKDEEDNVIIKGIIRDTKQEQILYNAKNGGWSTRTISSLNSTESWQYLEFYGGTQLLPKEFYQWMQRNGIQYHNQTTLISGKWELKSPIQQLTPQGGFFDFNVQNRSESVVYTASCNILQKDKNNKITPTSYNIRQFTISTTYKAETDQHFGPYLNVKYVVPNNNTLYTASWLSYQNRTAYYNYQPKWNILDFGVSQTVSVPFYNWLQQIAVPYEELQPATFSMRSSSLTDSSEIAFNIGEVWGLDWMDWLPNESVEFEFDESELLLYDLYNVKEIRELGSLVKMMTTRETDTLSLIFTFERKDENGQTIVDNLIIYERQYESEPNNNKWHDTWKVSQPIAIKFNIDIEAGDFSNWFKEIAYKTLSLDKSSIAMEKHLSLTEFNTLDWRMQRYYQYLLTQDTTYLGKEMVENIPFLFDIIDGTWRGGDPVDYKYYIDMIDINDVVVTDNISLIGSINNEGKKYVSQSGYDALAKAYDYAVHKISRRAKVINSTEVNCLFKTQGAPSTQVFVLNPDDPKLTEQELEIAEELVQECKMKGQEMIIVSQEVFNNLDCQTHETSAYDLLRSQLHEFLSYNENINLSTIPVYHLDVNTRITVEDEKSDIHGDYIIQSIQIPLTINGQMTINAKRAIERI